MKITFEAHPIETAPKDRPFMVYVPDIGWYEACASPPLWATLWAEIDDMRPGVSDQGEQP
jgi:hypothetical protein